MTSSVTAGMIMSFPVRTLEATATVAEARAQLLRHGYSGLPVVDGLGQFVGLISQRDMDIALHYGFGAAAIGQHLVTHCRTVTPDTAISALLEILNRHNLRRLPVLVNRQIVGIITTADILRAIGQHALQLPTQPVITLLPTLQQALKPEFWQVLQQASAIATAQRWQLYIVGGAVRDLLLKTQDQQGSNLLLPDIDLMVDGATEGAGIELAKTMQGLHPDTQLTIHAKFQTAALKWQQDRDLGNLEIDLATARTEFYPFPAANPEVASSSIDQDLHRRDFTINAMAIRLTGPDPGSLIDRFGGLEDLPAQHLRIIHPNSIIEDPTRIYRGVRFAVRFGFQFEPQTQQAIETAIASGIYQRIQQQHAIVPALQTRLKAELKYVLQSTDWQAVLAHLDQLQALTCLHPALHLTDTLWQQLRLAADWETKLDLLLASLPPLERTPTAKKLSLPPHRIERLQALTAAETQIAAGLARHDRPSQLVQLLQPYDNEMLDLIALRGDADCQEAIYYYRHHWSQVKPPLDGKDLQAIGYGPGPQFKQMLQALTVATLDGIVTSREEALAFLDLQFPR